MNISPSNILPKLFPSVLKQQAAKIQVSPLLIESSTSSPEPLLVRFGTSLLGLTGEQAAHLLEQHGPNVIAGEQSHSWLRLLRNAVINPLVILLTVIGVVAFLTQDYDTAVIISLMVVLGLVLRFVQEYRADIAAAKLRAMSTCNNNSSTRWCRTGNSHLARRTRRYRQTCGGRYDSR